MSYLGKFSILKYQYTKIVEIGNLSERTGHQITECMMSCSITFHQEQEINTSAVHSFPAETGQP